MEGRIESQREGSNLRPADYESVSGIFCKVLSINKFPLLI